ncbi:DUF4365 domain-containing protein [Arthrobacter crusticola]|uniref:DUF4365 domain-containing protein n=1 Tax=Arthrobacter crusticola TaxID=2547960 RepID=A0A4R5TNG3_9MICC|nr:DUF4365 domain-containing protein [Arthrobacter crusticola]TDK23504.1 DUF4365 domain-containing protein [Arthrobacter crusticola]
MSEFTNRKAVNAVEKLALQIGWFFRPQDISDQGIDAHVEEVRLSEEEGKPTVEVGTGRLIAIQIKGGPSYFRKPSANGWWFPFSAKKAKLWLGHALPVVVVLVDLKNNAVYWQRISSTTVLSTGKGYKVEVPSSQPMSAAGKEWRHIASGLETLAEARFEHALTQLPPPVCSALQARPPAERQDAALLASHLAEGRANPRGTAQSLLAASPLWIERNGSWAWAVVATYAAQHEEYDVSAEAFERAGRASVQDCGSNLAAAALNIMAFDRKRSGDLLDEAAATGDAPLLVAVGRALLANPDENAGPLPIDPILLADSDEVRKASPVQAFLAEQAMRRGDMEGAVRHWRLQLQSDSGNTHSLRLGSEILRRRGSSSPATDDLSEAATHLESAISQRRRWAGPTTDLLEALSQCYMLQGRFETVLQICLPGPIGSATHEESEDPRMLRFALNAAYFLGRQNLVVELAQRLGETVSDRILKMRVGLLDPSPEEARELWSAEFDRAVDTADYRQIVIAGIALADLGVDKSSSLDSYVAQSIMPSWLVDFVKAAHIAYADLDRALPALRMLALEDPMVGEHLIMKLREARRFLEAAETCQALYSAAGNPWFLIRRASCLVDAGDENAEAAASLAANTGEAHPVERARLLTFLAEREGGRGNWDVAETHLVEALKLFGSPGPAEVWRVVVSQLNQGKAAQAAELIAKYRPVARTKEEATLWARANATVMWDESKASEALALARRFPDPKLSIALLGQLISNTYAVDQNLDPAASEAHALDTRRRLGQGAVPGELHRQAFAAMQELVSEFGDETGVTVLQGMPEEAIGQLTEILKERAAEEGHLRDLIRAVRNATVPIGLFAGLRNHSYAAILVERAFGVLVAGSADDDEHAHEVAAARAALGQSIVVDAAALLTLSGHASVRGLSGHFASLQVTAATMGDVHRGVSEIRGRAGSPGTLTWDPDQSALVFRDLPEAEFVRQLRRAEALEGFAQKLHVRVVTEVSVFEEVGNEAEVTLLNEVGNEAEHSPWSHSIQLAHDEALALWSDDLGLRRLARALDLPSFGTPALVDAVRDRSLELSSAKDTDDDAILTATSANLLLAQDFLVDLVLADEDLLNLAERDAWLPRAASAVLTRAAWWVWQMNPLEILLKLYSRVREARPGSLSDWQLSAMTGIGRLSTHPETSAKLLALVALIGFGLSSSDSEILDGIRRAKAVAAESNFPDPTLQIPAAAVELARMGLCDEPIELAARILDRLDAPEAPGTDGEA